MLPETSTTTRTLAECDPPAALVNTLVCCRADYYRALDLPLDTYDEQAARADALGTACARTAAGWAAPARWMFTPGTDGARPHWVFASAVLVARRWEENNVQFWRDTAAFWRQHAAGIDPDAIDDGRHLVDPALGQWAS